MLLQEEGFNKKNSRGRKLLLKLRTLDFSLLPVPPLRLIPLRNREYNTWVDDSEEIREGNRKQVYIRKKGPDGGEKNIGHKTHDILTASLNLNQVNHSNTSSNFVSRTMFSSCMVRLDYSILAIYTHYVLCKISRPTINEHFPRGTNFRGGAHLFARNCKIP